MLIVLIIFCYLIKNYCDETGCLNGGGQIKPKPGQSPKDLLQALAGVYMENVSIYLNFTFYQRL